MGGLFLGGASSFFVSSSLFWSWHGVGVFSETGVTRHVPCWRNAPGESCADAPSYLINIWFPLSAELRTLKHQCGFLHLDVSWALPPEVPTLVRKRNTVEGMDSLSSPRLVQRKIQCCINTAG